MNKIPNMRQQNGCLTLSMSIHEGTIHEWCLDHCYTVPSGRYSLSYLPLCESCSCLSKQ